jgi:hypothetical protein
LSCNQKNVVNFISISDPSLITETTKSDLQKAIDELQMGIEFLQESIKAQTQEFQQ